STRWPRTWWTRSSRTVWPAAGRCCSPRTTRRVDPRPRGRCTWKADGSREAGPGVDGDRDEGPADRDPRAVRDWNRAAVRGDAAHRVRAVDRAGADAAAEHGTRAAVAGRAVRIGPRVPPLLRSRGRGRRAGGARPLAV